MQNRLFNAIGLCQKAGKAASGAVACEKAVKSGKAKLLLIEDSASNATKEQYKSMCDYYKIPFLIVEYIGEAIGKPGRIVLAVTDDAFCKMIQECIPQDYNQGE